MAVEFTTPVGRIVWGVPGKSKGKTRKNPVTKAQEPVLKDGVQVQVWAFGLAIDKATFEQQVWPYLSQEAATLYQGGAVPQKFAWKYTDCNEIDDEGKRYGAREGYEGCYVLAISTELQPPPMFKFNGTGYDQLPADAIKTGDYVAVGLMVKGNIPDDRSMTPSLYINPTVVEFVGYGTAISSVGAVNPMTALGGQARQLPPGASATPIGGGSAAGVGMPGMGAGAPAPMMAPGQPAPMAAPAPAMAPGQPAPAPMMAPPPAPAPAPAPVGPQRPTDPSHIAHAGTPSEQWWNGTAWTPAPVAAAPQLPPPAPDFVMNAGMPAPAPMMAPGQTPGYPAQPGMMPGR